MNRTRRYLWVLVLVLLAIPTATVFAKELGSLTITGPGIDGEMTLDHPGGMMKLEQTGFFDQGISIKPEEKFGEGYNITAYLNLDGQIVPFVQLVYYATDGSQPGYVHFTARLTGETLQPVDQWRQLNQSADTAFRGLMEEYNITLQPGVALAAAAEAAASSAKEPVSEPAAVQPETVKAQTPVKAPAVSVVSNPMILALAISLLVLLSAGLILKRRTAGHRSSQAS